MYANLIKLRIQHGYSQREMADLISCSREHYNRCERGNGKSNFDAAQIDIILKHFGKKYGYVFLKSNPTNNAK